MCPFRRVEDGRAGPTALGILVPPSRRTVLILRPRTLVWDLVLAQASGSGFRELGRDEAQRLAPELAGALEAWSGGGPGGIETVYSLDQDATWLRLRVGGFTLTVCARVPGRPYQPLLFADRIKARAAHAALQAVLCPAADAEQELYLNTFNFTRPG